LSNSSLTPSKHVSLFIIVRSCTFW